jgi:hypothetical protein
MKKTIIALLASVFILGTGVAIAAVAWDGESTETAKANFCSSLTDLSSTVMSYQGLDPRTATNDEMESAADDIADAYDNVVDEAYDFAAADDNALTDAYNDLYYAIEGLDGDNTMSQNLADLEDELAAFPSAYAETFDGSGCSNV